MAYFLPSYFQKRFFKYVLSYFGLLDTEALDPDSLGIRWGQQSTVELHDIGLRLDKLATLLHLPTSSKLSSARIRHLKVTVPADFYRSAIICEASGFDVHLRLPSEKETCAAKDGLFDGHKFSIPTPADLAQSFLQTETKEEKEKLRAAISSRSETLNRTSASISDDEEELGLGDETISLPSFFTAFVKGVRDRLQVLIDDISIWVDVETKQDGSSKRQPEEKPDLISGLLSICQVNVGAVVTASTWNEHSLHLGQRPISLSGVNLSLVSEPAVFSNYSRFTAPASPVSPASPLPSKSSQLSSPASSVPPVSSSVSSSNHSMMQSTIFQPSHHTVDAAEDEHDVARLEASTYTYDGRFSDADTEETRSHGYLEEPHNLSEEEKLLDNPAYLDSVIDSHLQEDDLEDLNDVSPDDSNQPSTDRSTPWLQNSGLGALGKNDIPSRAGGTSVTPASEPSIRNVPSQHPGFGNYAPQSSMPSLSPPRTENFVNSTIHSSRPIPISPSETSSSGSASGYFNVELSESKLFSNDEAQSMYMSAMSHGSDPRSFMPNIPGAFESPEATIVRESIRRRDLHGPTEETIDQNDQDQTPISTPKPTDNEVAKRFLHIDRVTIWIPSTKHEQDRKHESESSDAGIAGHSFNDSTAHLESSQIGEKSVSFSKVLPSSRTRCVSTDSAITDTDIKHDNQPDTKHIPESHDDDNDIAIEISSVDIQFDVAIGWLVVKFGQRVHQAFGGNGQASATGTSRQNDVQDREAFGLTLSKLSLKFVEHVTENPFFRGRQQVPPTALPEFMHDDIVLQSTASGLKAHFSAPKNVTRFSAEVSKFAIGFASEDLISFSEELKMRESTRDILSPVGNDISLSLTKSRESATFTISTLPLCVNLNIPRLDEVLGWFGGLSTIMELGSSISSLSGNKGPKRDVPKRARGVRFEGTSPPPARGQTTNPTFKVNARIGGIALDVAGENHYLMLRTTAAKVVSRFEGIALQIDKAKLSGPLSLHDPQDAPAKINLSNIRVEYAYTPKETDLDRLLSLITPSGDKYDEDDDIILDTLFRQRKQGSVLRVTVAGAKAVVSSPDLEPLQQLGEEIVRLSNVAKYLPEDDRPGILTLALVRELEARLYVGGKIGTITAKLEKAEAAHISIPSLIAAQLGSISVVRNGDEELIGEALPPTPQSNRTPTLMARFIADEMDPTIKVKLHNLRVEYTISAITAFLGINDEMTSVDVAANMASLANLAELQPPPKETAEERSTASTKPAKLKVALRDCVVGLNPRGTAARGLLILTHSSFSGTIQDLSSSDATLDLKTAFILIIDDLYNIESETNLTRQSAFTPHSRQVQAFIDKGYVLVSSISSASATVKIMRLGDDGTKSLDVEIRDDLLILDTCADSTQALISIINGLQPPSPPSEITKYRTQVVPIRDMFESFSGDEFPAGSSEDPSAQVHDRPTIFGHIVDEAEIPEIEDFDYVTDIYPDGLPLSASNDLGNSFQTQYHVSSSVPELDFRDDHFTQKSSVGGTAHRWDSTQNTYGLSDDSKLQNSPLRLRFRDGHVIWNLFDGYDFHRTRDTISKTVKDVEKKAAEHRANSKASPNSEDEEGAVIGDCLFNSVYIGIPANRDPGELRGEINRNIDDLVSENSSYATTSTVTTPQRNISPSVKGKKLRLSRSKKHKMRIELKGVSADLVVFPSSSEETRNSLDIRVNELEIFDNIPTSTWRKFATYMHEAGEKETGSNMVHLEILTVQPVSELAASELIIKASILPLRLHVDQDALDFLSRFFEFRDDSAPSKSPQEPPYLQRSEINSVRVKLDFKPKRVDYAGLRSGRTTEFMNFFILDEADMVLKHVIIYGASGFDKLGETLNNIWMSDVKQHQLPGVLAGLAPIRSLVNVGSGVRDLVVIPMREYRKDGRIVRSIQKGASAFAKTTSNELVKLGAKLAIGTQTVLQDAEGLLTTPAVQPAGSENDEIDEDEAARKISLYADQPIGVVQGLRGAFRGLERDLLLTRDAIIAVPGEVQESGSAKAAARAVLKRAPTVIFRPAIGVSKAVGQALLGAGNSMDPSNRRKMDDKYKLY
ncbi:autophagy-related protein 2 [Aspergillus aurantiobrunneus]